ncbi:hypothetical protein M9H77_18686 [Catharanthus roseus]|uniref:Uncharacterized protein n=1 Tax=Catharanthus roseus TaxID=4058 RepID=A0ACC0B8E3_CATRO|nr:hypothetical protein M9H77_18686 [Catharanthus roseus]
MDGSSGYNQIKMAPQDEELTAFHTPKDIYCYELMPFGLKNPGATYQRAMQNIFDDMLHEMVECYVDDLVVKSQERGDHLEDFKIIFERLRRYQIKMNPLKCGFGVTSGNFLGFIVYHRGIEIDQSKIDAILKMPEPHDIDELRSLQGKLAYLQRFISNFAGWCKPFSHLVRKGTTFERDEACKNSFKNIKLYLIKPLVLAAPTLGKPLVLYIAVQELHVIFKENPIKYVMSIPILSDLVKGLVLADFLADYPILTEWELNDELPDENVLVIEVLPSWKMFFDGASHREGAGAGAGIVFLIPEGDVLPYMFTLSQQCSNNIVEYQAFILWLELIIDMKQLQLEVYGDSQLVVNQLLGVYELGDVTISHVLRNGKYESRCIFFEVDKEDWIQPFIDYLKQEKLPNDPQRRTNVRRQATRFIYYKDTLYLGEEEIVQAMEEAHFGICGAHPSGPKFHFHIKIMEVIALKETKKENVVDFIQKNIIYHYRVPRYIITDNGKPFCNGLMNKLYEKFGFKQHNSSMYYAPTNGLAEAFNKTLCKLLQKVRTTYCTPTQATPYALAYGVEVILPLE